MGFWHRYYGIPAVKFLRLADMKVHTRNDMVVVQGKMPFRSVGGLKDTPTLQINSANAADMERVLRVRWDEEEDDENGGNQEVQEQENASPATTMVGSRTPQSLILPDFA